MVHIFFNFFVLIFYILFFSFSFIYFEKFDFEREGALRSLPQVSKLHVLLLTPQYILLNFPGTFCSSLYIHKSAERFAAKFSSPLIDISRFFEA